MTQPLGLSLVCITSVLVLGACAGASPTELGDTGESAEDALGLTSRCTHVNMASSACSTVRAQILADASAGRVELLKRGFDWIDRGIMYSQTHTTDGYRRDCSGFVSMVWGESPANTTASYAPFNKSSSHQLASYDDLVPGDALNKVPREHIVLFAGWANKAHTSMYILEESQTGYPALMAQVSSSYFSKFRPIRSDAL